MKCTPKQLWGSPWEHATFMIGVRSGGHGVYMMAYVYLSGQIRTATVQRHIMRGNTASFVSTETEK